MEEFCARYREAALAYANEKRDDMSLYNGAYVLNISRNCWVRVEVAQQYKIPSEVWDPVHVGSIIKPYANTLTMSLSAEINWDSMTDLYVWDLCSRCGISINHNKNRWVCDDTNMCKVCYQDFRDDNPMSGLAYKKTRRCENILDYIAFMDEIRNDDYTSTFYVNCNPRSPHYGRVLNRDVTYITRADGSDLRVDVLDELYHCSTLLPQIREWLETTPEEYMYTDNTEYVWDTMLPVDCVWLCQTFLRQTSKFAQKFNALCKIEDHSHRFFLAHPDVWFLADDSTDINAALATMELNEIRDDAIEYAERKLLNVMLYKSPHCRSFTRSQLKFK